MFFTASLNFVSRVLLVLAFCVPLSFSHSRDYEEGDEMIPLFSELTSSESMSSTQSVEEQQFLQEEEIILPFYSYIYQLPCDLWEEIMIRLTIPQVMRVSATCKLARSTFMAFDIWKFLEKFVKLRCELASIISSHPGLFSPKGRGMQTFVWPEETGKIIQQIAHVMRSGDALVSSISDYLKLSQEEETQKEEKRIVWENEGLQMLVGKIEQGIFSNFYLSNFLNTALESYPLTSNNEVVDDLKSLLQREYDFKKAKKKLRGALGCHRIFRNRWVVAGLSASAAVVCTGVLYAYLHKFPTPLGSLLTWNNITYNEFVEGFREFPYFSRGQCFENDWARYYWQHDPSCFYENPQRLFNLTSDEFYHKGYRIDQSHIGSIDEKLNDFMSFLRRRFDGLNTTSWKEYILNCTSGGSIYDIKSICTVDLGGRSLTCVTGEKANNNVDFHLYLKHANGDCAYNWWLFSLINLVFLSAETISLPLILMASSFLCCAVPSHVFPVSLFVIPIILALQWLVSLMLTFI